MKKRVPFTFWLMLLPCFLYSAASPQAASVSSPDEASLRAAMSAGGVVTFAFDGTIQLTNTITIDKDVTLNGSGHTVTISGNNMVRVFDVPHDGITFTLKNLTITRGAGQGINNFSWAEGGGGLRNNGGTVLLENCVFSENKAVGCNGADASAGSPVTGEGGWGCGGAILNLDGRIFATNVHFLVNQAVGGRGGNAWMNERAGLGGHGKGGAVFAGLGLVELVDCRFSGNQANPGNSGSDFGIGSSSGNSYGGAIYVALGSILQVNKSTFVTNFAAGGYSSPLDDRGHALGGAIYQEAGATMASDCWFTGNQAQAGVGASKSATAAMTAPKAFGGAFCVDSGIAYLTNSTFSSNAVVGGYGRYLNMGYPLKGGSGMGGAICNSADTRLVNCTLTGNQATGGVGDYYGGDGNGGGFAHLSGSAFLLHVTVANNQATGGRGAVAGVGSGGNIWSALKTLLLINSIVAHSPAGTNSVGPLLDGGYNLSSDGSCNFDPTTSLNNTDPKLGPLAIYGGLTPTLPLLIGSPAIDAASDTANLPTDQRGVCRPKGRHSDIGAFEFGFNPVERDLVGGVILTFTATANQTCTLQASTNLIHWSDTLTNKADTDGTVHFGVPPTQGQPARFFRTKMP